MCLLIFWLRGWVGEYGFYLSIPAYVVVFYADITPDLNKDTSFVLTVWRYLFEYLRLVVCMHACPSAVERAMLFGKPPPFATRKYCECFFFFFSQNKMALNIIILTMPLVVC